MKGISLNLQRSHMLRRRSRWWCVLIEFNKSAWRNKLFLGGACLVLRTRVLKSETINKALSNYPPNCWVIYGVWRRINNQVFSCREVFNDRQQKNNISFACFLSVSLSNTGLIRVKISRMVKMDLIEVITSKFYQNIV